MSLEYNEKNITLAKNLRKNATPQENICGAISCQNTK